MTPMHCTGTGGTSSPDEANRIIAADQLPHAAAPAAVLGTVSLVVPLDRDITYDHREEQARMTVDVILGDGSTRRAELVLNPPQMYATAVKLGRAIGVREDFRPVGVIR
ncbi:hypothetical protein [Streptomyces sp. NPDC059209]|uniref:hypothetical protein n=1 Tax=unclassified Streptomyces TaxID=2593676 RepID=UPI0036B6ACC1